MPCNANRNSSRGLDTPFQPIFCFETFVPFHSCAVEWMHVLIHGWASLAA